MKKLISVGVLALLVASLSIAGLALGQGGSEWTYEGETGPDNWGELDPSFAACSEGASQSPINLVGAVEAELTELEFHYEAVPLAIFNNGHTIEVEYEAGSHVIFNEKQYDVLQFHFHHASEHTVDGVQYPLELHIVHKNAATNQLLVVGVLLEEGDASNEAFAEIFADLPAEEGEPAHDAELTINAADLLPADTESYFTYEGSLTTPPCSETVRWIVLTTPMTLSADQIAAFGEIYDGNFRPVQDLNTHDLFFDPQG